MAAADPADHLQHIPLGRIYLSIALLYVDYYFWKAMVLQVRNDRLWVTHAGVKFNSPSVWKFDFYGAWLSQYALDAIRSRLRSESLLTQNTVWARSWAGLAYLVG